MTSIKELDVNHLIGKEIGTSTILSELARGGMAIIFIAYQRTLKRRIAVKILPKTLLTHQKAEQFQQEAEAAAILSHPNIIQIYDVGKVDEFIYFTMQLIQGEPLTNRLKRLKKQVLPSKRFMPVKVIIQIMTQILEALDYAHQQGIIHRDIKPDNIMIEEHTQRPIITDFGVAKVLREANEDHSIARGSPLYMPPEQIIDESTDERSDLYAAGIMLFEMLVPRLPLPKFESYEDLLKQKLLNKKGIFLAKPSELNPFLNMMMDQIVLKAITYEPEERFGNCCELKNALEEYQKKYL
ncbi:MAG: serine/threonine-protein kinase [Desulfobacterales bacterium]